MQYPYAIVRSKVQAGVHLLPECASVAMYRKFRLGRHRKNEFCKARNRTVSVVHGDVQMVDSLLQVHTASTTSDSSDDSTVVR